MSSKYTLTIILALASISIASAQTRKISGTVVDASNNEAIIGATVYDKVAKNGVMTDIEGRYTIEASSESTLIISCIGYIDVEEKVANRNIIDVKMSEDINRLEEVVVIGYGTMDKKELTSAISHISSKDFLSGSGGDPAKLIQGKVAGVSVSNTGAADPNNTASIQIRGISSRSAGLGPLVVIDGVPGGNMSNLNQNDIESIDILKDGAASAIYGTRGSNGVVLITTKKGSKDGSVHTSYNLLASADFIIRELDMLNADEFREKKVPLGASDLGGDVKDWLSEVSRVGITQQHTITLSGGNAKNSYRVSADYRNAKGIDRRGEREEYGARAFLNHTSESGLFSFTVNIAPRVVNAVGSDWHTFHRALEANPTSPILDPNDPTYYFEFYNQQAMYNPVEENNTVLDDRMTKILDWSASAKLNINDHLSTQLTFADSQVDKYNSWYRTARNRVKKGFEGEASKSYELASQYSLEWLVNYNQSFGAHNVKLMGGYSYQYFNYSGFNASNQDFPSDSFTYNNLGQGSKAKDEGELGMGSYRNDSKLIAFFGRANYDYEGKWLATASLRYEGSSKFGANNKWGLFPAVSAGWRISKEDFMSDVNWINDLKLRADYGQTGNQDFASYLSLNTMTGFGDYYYDGKYFTVYGPSKNVNPDLRWEKGINWNVGLDFSILNNRLSGSINYFNRTQKDLLGDYNVAVPPYLFSNIFVNVGTMKNSGVELDLNYKVVDTKDFKYNLGLVASTMDNRFVSFSNDEFKGQDFFDIAGTEDPFPMHNLQRIEVGQRLGTYYMWHHLGFNKEGRFVIEGADGEPKMGLLAEESDMKVCGNGLPLLNASITNSFTYKNWDLTIFLRGAFFYSIFNIHDFYYGTKKVNSNVLKKAFGENDNISEYPIVCDYFLERGDYMKLDMVNLGYNLKLDGRHIHNIRLYLTGRNLFTLTAFSGVDPATYNVNGLAPGATGSRNYYPTTRQIIFGAQIDF